MASAKGSLSVLKSIENNKMKLELGTCEFVIRTIFSCAVAAAKSWRRLTFFVQ